MDIERIRYLLKVRRDDTATPEEEAEFSRIVHDPASRDAWDQALDEEWNELTETEVQATEMGGYHTVLEQVKGETRVRRFGSWWPRITIAATILLFAAAGAYFMTNASRKKTQAVVTTDVAPGKNGATLTLASGKKIAVNDVLAGQIARESGVKISKTSDGRLLYEIADADGGTGYNTLSTSRGEQTQVRLQDGTVVYLNAGSALTYPVSFAKAAKRQVQLSGEGYFEVAKDRHHPFVVTTAGQQVEVLGTVFNINGYADEASVNTTLLEGSVRISIPSAHAETIIKPGQQAVAEGDKLAVKEVITDDMVAWKNGYFMFNNETLESIMKKVARWYNVDVRYRDQSVKTKTFFGSVSRFDHVSELLKLLGKTGGASFELTGNEIVIDRKN